MIFSKLLGAAGSVSGFKYKAAAALAGVGLLVSASCLIMSRIEVGSLKHSIAKLDDVIYNPDTGYVAKLAQSETKTLQCKSGLEAQNKALEAQSALSAKAIANSQNQAKAAALQLQQASRKADSFIDQPSNDIGIIDNAILEDLSK